METKDNNKVHKFISHKEVEFVIFWSSCVEIKFKDGTRVDVMAEGKGDFTYLINENK